MSFFDFFKPNALISERRAIDRAIAHLKKSEIINTTTPEVVQCKNCRMSMDGMRGDICFICKYPKTCPSCFKEGVHIVHYRYCAYCEDSYNKKRYR